MATQNPSGPATSWRRLLPALVLVIAVVGIPHRGPERAAGGLFATVTPLRTLLARFAAGTFGADGPEERPAARLPALLAAAVSGVEAAGDAIEERLSRLARSSRDPYVVVGALEVVSAAAAFLDAAPFAADPAGSAMPPALRPIAALGAAGEELFRASETNWRALPDPLRAALEAQLAAIAACDGDVRREWTRLSAELPLDLALDQIRALLANGSGAGDATDSARFLVRRFDRAPFVRALARAAAAADRVAAELDALRPESAFAGCRDLPEMDGVPRGLLVAAQTDAGLVLVGGSGGTVLPLRGVAFALDVGGDDRYHGGAALMERDFADARVRVLVDAAGDDHYAGTGGTIAATRGGVSLLLDAAGDDDYVGGDLEFGAAEFGAALLLDAAGDDHVCATGRAGGFALAGLAAFVDLGGDDRYHCAGPGLGSGTAGGCGLLADLSGFDLYVAIGARGQPGTVASAGPSLHTLGAGWPLPGDIAGGIGVLLDGAGDDVYRAGDRCLGFAGEGSLGLAIDARGADLYAAGDASLGAAVGFGLALFRDLEGDDEVLSRTRSQGFGAGGAGLSIDDGGEDRRLALPPSQGIGTGRGSGVFVDVDALGDDRGD